MCSEFQERTLTSVINEFGEETVKCVLSNFICKKNVEVEEYLHNKAIYHELKGLARTILIFDPNNGMQLVGYYTISTKSFVIDIKLNTSQKKKYFGISKTNGNTLPSFLIGQLGKNEVVESEFNGDILMDYIFRYIKKMYKHTPSVITYVEHNGDKHLFDYYERHGFIYFDRKNEDKLFCHIIKTKDIIESLN